MILQKVYSSLRDEIEGDVDLTVDGNHILTKSSLFTNRNGVNIAAPLKYLSNFWTY